MEQIDEKRFQRARKKFLILALIGVGVLVGGIILAVKGFTGAFDLPDVHNPDDPLWTKHGGNIGMGVAGAFMCLVGFAMIGWGLMLAFGRNMANYGASMMTPAAAHMATTIAAGVKQAPNIEIELKKLDDLRTKKLITEDEYTKMRAKLLGTDK